MKQMLNEQKQSQKRSTGFALRPTPGPGRPPSLLKKVDQFLKLDEEIQHVRVKDRWAYASYVLVEQACAMARVVKKNECGQMQQLMTSAGIAYDKRWGSRDQVVLQIPIPPSLQAAISLSLNITPVESHSQPVRNLPISTVDGQSDTVEPVDIMHLTRHEDDGSRSSIDAPAFSTNSVPGQST